MGCARIYSDVWGSLVFILCVLGLSSKKCFILVGSLRFLSKRKVNSVLLASRGSIFKTSFALLYVMFGKIINRPGVAGAVLQTPPLLIH